MPRSRVDVLLRRVRLRTSDPAALQAVFHDYGLQVARDHDVLYMSGTSQAEVGQRAFDCGFALSVLITEAEGLEDVLLNLTTTPEKAFA